MALTSGSSVGPYKILESVGKGGMASVFKAYEVGLDRHVALKVLPSEFLHDEGFAERFRREAKTIARLEHPNIIPIHNFGIDEASRTPWMAMRLVSGGALSSILKKERLSAARTVAILKGVAEALDYAHGKGVIHRDVKPQNILLDEQGRVYLADFGIAKMAESSSGLTATGMISGTPHYMAPEQAMASSVDGRADIYALGVVAYEMLTGRVPFAADTPVAVLMKHVSDPMPVPSPAEVPEPLVRVLVLALAKRPEERWATASAFVSALDNAVAEAGPQRAAAAAPTGVMPARRQGSAAPGSGTHRAVAPAPDQSPAALATPPPGLYPPQHPSGSGSHPAITAVGPYPTRPGAPPPGYPPPAYPPTLPPGSYPPAYPQGYAGTPAPGTHPAMRHATATHAPVSSGTGPSRGVVIGLVGGVVAAGLVGTVVLLLLIRTGPAERPERPPVTLRSQEVAAGEPAPTTLSAAPATMAAAPRAPVTARVPEQPPPLVPPPTAQTVPPATVPQVTQPPATQVAAPAPTLPPATQPPRPAAPFAAAPDPAPFPGAGKVLQGGNFYEKVLTYAPEKGLPFDARIGPVKVPVVRFAIGVKVGHFGAVDTEKSMVKLVIPTIDCLNSGGGWSYKFLVELLDADGRALEKFDNGGSCKNQVKTVSSERALDKRLMSAARGVRVRMEAKD